MRCFFFAHGGLYSITFCQFQLELLLVITEMRLHPGHIFPIPWDERQNPNIIVFVSLIFYQFYKTCDKCSKNKELSEL